MNAIVFSKDRALQLDAFLRSYEDHVFPFVPLHVLRKATTQDYAEAYDQVGRQHPWAITMEQGASFRDDLLDLLPADGNVVFFVDDMVLTRRWDVLEESGLSLRLGLHLTRNYASGDTPQPIPPHMKHSDGRISWRWRDGVLAWGYPLSLDGHVFDAAEIAYFIELLSFGSPNVLESELQRYNGRFLDRCGTCYREARAVNVPWNLTQTDWPNRHGAGNGVDEMLTHWQNGKRIAVRSLYGVLNESVHQEFPLVLEDR